MAQSIRRTGWQRARWLLVDASSRRGQLAKNPRQPLSYDVCSRDGSFSTHRATKIFKQLGHTAFTHTTFTLTTLTNKWHNKIHNGWWWPIPMRVDERSDHCQRQASHLAELSSSECDPELYFHKIEGLYYILKFICFYFGIFVCSCIFLFVRRGAQDSCQSHWGWT